MKLFSTKYSEPTLSLSLLVFRLALGGLMISHGYKKLVNFAGKSEGFTDPFGIGGPASMSLAIFAEFFCAIFIVVGFMTRLSCIPLIIAMSVALFYSHDGKIFTEGEHAALFLGGYIGLLMAGPGRFSLDKVVGR